MIPIKIKRKIKVIIGNFKLNNGPFEIFNKDVVFFLNELSKAIMTNNKCKKFPDLISFGFGAEVAI